MLKNRRPVDQIDPITGEVLHTYESGAEAERQTGISANTINMCCKGHQNTSKGFIWRYAKTAENAVEENHPVVKQESDILTCSQNQQCFTYLKKVLDRAPKELSSKISSNLLIVLEKWADATALYDEETKQIRELMSKM